MLSLHLMFRGSAGILCAFLLCSLVQASGRKCPDQVFPEGYSSSGGWMITDPYARIPQYSLTLALQKERGDTLFLSRLLYNDEEGCAHWRIVREFKLPRRQKGIDLAYECRVNGVEDRAVFAYARNADEPEYTTLVYAWRAIIEQEKIVAISVKGITCTNQGYGL